ncbi:MAG: CRTAC1 family protein [Gemmatimonadota bacterium]|nr:CRTAC1 family protein [Gemmatimonadota bacterium]
MSGRRCRVLPAGVLLLAAACAGGDAGDGSHAGGDAAPAFTRHQPDLFGADGAQPNAWGDFDNDGDLDLFVGFRGRANRLYRNDGGTFVDVAPELGLADEAETRAAAWGDHDADGDLDLFVGFRLTPGMPNRLYVNPGGPGEWVDVAPSLGIALEGNTRQPSFVDYDGDGDLDFFVAFREQANRLFRNDGGEYVDVTERTGVGDPRRTVGVAWFDYDADGDLDLFVANQNGDEDAFFRNDGNDHFVDVAPELGMNRPDRGDEFGSVGPAVVDHDNDGDLDLFIATYGPDVLWENQGDGTFRDVAPGTVLSGDYHSTTAAWGDYDNDGWADLFVVSYLSDVAEVPDHLFRNLGGSFAVTTPANVLEMGASHGVAWADFDGDGDLDLAVANNHNPDGTHHLYRNELPADVAARAVQVSVVDGEGRWTRPGAEVRVYGASAGDGPRLLGSRLLDTGGGYCSQGAAPVHFGIPSGIETVDVEVTFLLHGERRTERREGVPVGGGAVVEIRTGG